MYCSYTIGHEFQAIFLSLFEPVQNDELNAFYVKSLFNPYVFNTVITRAKACVVAIGRLKEVQQFEDETLSHPCQGGNKIKCWHEYLALCKKQGTLSNHPDTSALYERWAVLYLDYSQCCIIGMNLEKWLWHIALCL